MMKQIAIRNEQFRGIKSWPEDEKPREKLILKGAGNLSDAELIGILIGTGTVRHSALDLARHVLDLAHQNLHELGRVSIREMQRTKGIGVAKAVTIAAALEIGRRRQISQALERPAISQSQDVADIVIPLLRDLSHEVFCVLYLNQSNRLLRHELISSGGLTGTVADIRVILKNALLQNANALILVHNHPSGNIQPSRADRELTMKIKEAAGYMDIRLLDHMIIGNTLFFSMRDEGMI